MSGATSVLSFVLHFVKVYDFFDWVHNIIEAAFRDFIQIFISLDVLGFRVVLGWAYRGLIGGFLLLQNFSVAISVSPHVCFS